MNIYIKNNMYSYEGNEITECSIEKKNQSVMIRGDSFFNKNCVHQTRHVIAEYYYIYYI